MYSIVPVPFVVKMSLSLLNCLCFVKNQSTIYVWVYSVPLNYLSIFMKISHCLQYYTFIISSWSQVGNIVILMLLCFFIVVSVLCNFIWILETTCKSANKILPLSFNLDSLFHVLVSLAKISNTMLNKTVKSRYLWLLPNLGRVAFNLPPLSMMLAIEVFVDVLYQIEDF